MIKLFRNISFTPARLFAIGAAGWLVAVVVYKLFLGNFALDIGAHDVYLNIQVRDTYYVIGTVYLMTALAGGFAIVCAVYYLFPILSGRSLNRRLGVIHFWISLVVAWLIIWPQWALPWVGMPRRWFDHGEWVWFNRYMVYNRFLSLGVLLFLLAQLLFLFNVFYSMFRGRKRVGRLV